MRDLLKIIVPILLLYSCGLTIVIPKNSEKAQLKNNEKITQSKKIERAIVPPSREAYIAMYKNLAIKKMKTYNIPASITLAQGILESGSGSSELAKNANNHFGIKCGSSWKGQVYYKDDDAKHDCFRVYNKAEYSFDDHSKILLLSRYRSLFDLEVTDYKGWAKGLKRCGYATNPKYPEILTSLIERYKLYEYDNTEKPKQKEIIEKVLDSKISEEKKEKLKEIENINKEENEIIARKTISSFITTEEKITTKYIVKKGDTLYSISKKYNIDIEQLRRINKLEDNIISIGQELVIITD